MKNYYFVTSSFPEIHIGARPDMSFSEASHLFSEMLAPSDLEKTRVIRRYYDLQNIRAFWLDQEFDSHGNYDRAEMERAFLLYMGFPDYVFEFLDQYSDVKSRLLHFPELVSRYYSVETAKASGFLKTYLTFEHEWRLTLAAFRAKKLNRDLVPELQYEDPDDLVVAQILAQKDAKSFEPTEGYEELKPIFEKFQEAPLELHQALCDYRFNKINQFLGLDLFSIDRVLGFEAQLILVEKWMELDQKKGREIMDSIVKEAK